jgi:hypothetical protein
MINVFVEAPRAIFATIPNGTIGAVQKNGASPDDTAAADTLSTCDATILQNECRNKSQARNSYTRETLIKLSLSTEV